MEGIGYLFLLLGFLLFLSILFTGLLVSHFLKYRPSALAVVLMALASIALSIVIIDNGWFEGVGFTFLLFYAALALGGYLLIVGFSGEKPVPHHKKES